jgi:hypothetical protein
MDKGMDAVTDTDYVRLRVSSGYPAEYIFFAAWELSQDILKVRKVFLICSGQRL